MFPSHRKSEAGPAIQPLSDDESRAQVVDPARQLAAAAGLNVTNATFGWEWCNDQGDPPYHGRVDVAFKLPPEVTDKTAYFQKIAAQAAKLPGWAPGPPPGLNPYGEVAHSGGTMMIIGVGNYPENGEIQVFGECRNMNDHRTDSEFHGITDEVRGG